MSAPSSFVITGVGAVTGLGLGVDVVAQALAEGRSALRVDDGLQLVRASVAAADLRWPQEARWKDQRKYAGRAGVLALTAVDQALPPEGPPVDAERTVSVVCVEPDATEWRALAQVIAPDDERTPAERVFEDMDDFHILRTLTASVAQVVAMRVKSRNGTLAVPTPSARGMAGLALARSLLAFGEADTVVLAGVSQALVEYELAVRRRRALTCEALDAVGDANGTASEGAAALVVETQEQAQRRGVRPLARLRGACSFAARRRGEALELGLSTARREGWPRPHVLIAPAAPSDVSSQVAGGGAVLNPSRAVGMLPQADAVLATCLGARALSGGVVGPVWLLTWADTEDGPVGLACLEPVS